MTNDYAKKAHSKKKQGKSNHGKKRDILAVESMSHTHAHKVAVTKGMGGGIGKGSD